MSEKFQDFNEKKIFLEFLGLTSAIKREKINKSDSNAASIKISLNEIIVIDDEEDDSVGIPSVILSSDKSKLLSKTKKAKTSKITNFLKAIRGNSKKLLLMDISSPLGRNIDFSSGKPNKFKSIQDCVLQYEKWCSTSVNKPIDADYKPKNRFRDGRQNVNGDVSYNFRKRPRRVGDKLSDRSQLLLQSLRTCFVVLMPFKGSITTETSDKPKRIPFDHPQTSDKAKESHKNVETPEDRIDKNIDSEVNTQGIEDDFLIREVYSLAPGASPDLPTSLLEMGRDIIRCHEHKASIESSRNVTEESHNLSNPTVDLEILPKACSPKISESEPASVPVFESRNANVIDLCDVDYEDCYVMDCVPTSVLNQGGMRPFTAQPLKQISQDHSRSANEPIRDGVSPSRELRILSFLCRICNQIIRCRGFYKNDVLKHYEVQHNISSVNLVSHTENGKIVWKVVEKPRQPENDIDFNCQKYRKRTKENNLFSDAEQQKRVKYDQTVVSLPHPTSTVSASALTSYSTSVKQNNVTSSNLANLNSIHEQFHNSDRARLELFSSDVIYID